MALASQNSRTAAFFAIGVGVTLAMAALKALAAWLMDVYVYSIPWVGGFLRSIELVELSNLIVFAILGASLGAATLLLPWRWDHRAKLALLAAVSPLVFCGSYMMQQHLWIKRVAAQSNIDYGDARTITNAYLNREVGSGGFFGFFPLSTQLSELPIRRDSLESAQSINPTEALTQELSDLDDPRADFAAILFERVGWLVRFMYIVIAGFTGLIHYFKGHNWADAQRRLDSGGPAVREQAVRPAAGKSSPRKSVLGGRSQKSKSALGRQSSGKQSSNKPFSSKQSSGKQFPGKSKLDRSRLNSSKPGQSSLGKVAREQSRKSPLGKLNDQPSSQSKGQSGSQSKGQSNTLSSGQSQMNLSELPGRRSNAEQPPPSPKRPPNSSAPNSSPPN